MVAMHTIYTAAEYSGCPVLNEPGDVSFYTSLLQHKQQFMFSDTMSSPRDRSSDTVKGVRSRGATIPFGANAMRLIVTIGIEGLPPQPLVLDTGSSTLAFCNESLPSHIAANETQFMACEQYGPRDAAGNFTDGYIGPYLKGTISMSEDVQIRDARYVIFNGNETCAGWMCSNKGGYNGLFGLAYKRRNQAYSNNADISQDCTDKKIQRRNQIRCPRSENALFPSLMQELVLTREGRLGIYWSSVYGHSTGAMYLGPDAISNPHYSAGSVQKAKLLDMGQHSSGWYNVNVTRISVGGQSYTGFGCDSMARPCILDTGTPVLVLPEGVNLSESNAPVVELELESYTASAPVMVKFNFTGVPSSELHKLVITSSGGATGKWNPLMIIGLPTWAQYYTVFDYMENSVAFVAHPGNFDYALHEHRT
jgi:hypothetical protein